MKRKLRIGVTGGIACGKTEVLEILRRRGFRTVSADRLAHTCLRPGHLVYREVLRRFGRGILKGRQIDRRRLGTIVFRDARKRKALERLIHPYVIRALEAHLNRGGMAAADIPLLFEAGLERLVDATVVVTAPQRLQISRLRRRSGLSRSDALRRIYAQMPLSWKVRKADFVIRNSGSRSALRRRVASFIESLSV